MKRVTFIITLTLFSFVAKSQDITNPELKFSGYVQTQWTWNEANISSGKQNDFSVRRGRIKAAYTNKYGEAVIQLDATEDGVGIKDAYIRIKEPRVKWLSLRAGVFDRPFGNEISYSSSRRETPERSLIFQTLFPKERDLGAEVVIRGPESTVFSNFTLNAGLFVGNGGQSKETDSHKDFIGHLTYQKTVNNIKFGIGASLYAGGVRLAGDETQKAYKIENKEFVQDTNLTSGDYAQRRYYGFDGQFALSSVIGTTSLRAEYLWGIQPGAMNGSKSPTGAIVTDIFSRNFSGYYLYFIQAIGKSKHSFVAKYDAYDPNTKLSGNECRNIGDIRYSTWGIGWLYQPNSNVRIMCYYDMVSNEKVNNDFVTEKYVGNVADNVFTLRLQYGF